MLVFKFIFFVGHFGGADPDITELLTLHLSHAKIFCSGMDELLPTLVYISLVQPHCFVHRYCVAFHSSAASQARALALVQQALGFQDLARILQVLSHPLAFTAHPSVRQCTLVLKTSDSIMVCLVGTLSFLRRSWKGGKSLCW
jgi:hypothetical protein